MRKNGYRQPGEVAWYRDDTAKVNYWLGRNAWSREQYRAGRRCIFGLRHLLDLDAWDIYYAALRDAHAYSPYMLEGMRSAAHATTLKPRGED